jgi:RHS repeat-associated protein
LNRLISIDYGGQQQIAWVYDQTGPGFSNGRGRLTSTKYPWGSSTYAYDSQGRLLSFTQTSNETGIGHTIHYGYDLAGRVISITYPSGRKLHVPHTGGLPTSMGIAPDPSSPAVMLLSELQFVPAVGGQGPARSWNWNLDSGAVPHERVFDESGRMVRHPLGGAVRDITYDAADRVVRFSHYNAASGASVPVLNQVFGYDALGRLTSVDFNGELLTYSYDDNGNRTRLTAVSGSANTLRTYLIDGQSNRLLGATDPPRTLSYDEAGNVEADQEGAWALYASYDLSGRLVETRSSTNGQNFKLTRYAYNADGQRVFKETFAQQSCTPEGTCSTVPIARRIGTVYVYDQEGRLLGEYESGSGRVIREYVWLQSSLVAIIDGKTTSPAIAYVHTDHLDTPRTVIDRQGRQRWTWVSEPFGNSLPVTNPLGFGEYVLNVRMPGQYYDAETGLSDNWYRSYDPSIGRYTQSDPIGLAGGINTYSYVDSAPTMYTDPKGLIRWTGSMGGGGLIGGVGASYYTFDLLSECVNGKQARVRGYAIGGSAGIGATAAGSRGTTVFEDNETDLRPDGFNGRFAMYGAGVAIGRGRPGNMASEGVLDALGRQRPDNGISFSDVILGNARTAPGSNFGTVRGLDLSVSFSAGSSIVTSVTYNDCECSK